MGWVSIDDGVTSECQSGPAKVSFDQFETKPLRENVGVAQDMTNHHIVSAWQYWLGRLKRTSVPPIHGNRVVGPVRFYVNDFARLT